MPSSQPGIQNYPRFLRRSVHSKGQSHRVFPVPQVGLWRVACSPEVAHFGITGSPSPGSWLGRAHCAFCLGWIERRPSFGWYCHVQSPQGRFPHFPGVSLVTCHCCIPQSSGQHRVIGLLCSEYPGSQHRWTLPTARSFFN